MWRILVSLTAALCLLVFPACKSKEAASADQPRATVLMRDGTQSSGAVVASSPQEITLRGDDNATRTIAMNQVRSVEYSDAAPPPPSPETSAPAQPAPAEPNRTQPPPQPTHERHYHPERSVIRTKTYELPVGTEISVRAEETIDSARAVDGQTFAAEAARDVTDASGDVVIPRGSNAQIVIKSASKGGRIRGASDLVLDLQSVSVDGQLYRLDTTDMLRRGQSGIGANKRTAEYTGGGGAIGAIIGAIAGGGKGAAIGAGAGAGAGALTQILTKGSIKVPAETVLTFKLDSPLRVVAAK